MTVQLAGFSQEEARVIRHMVDPSKKFNDEQLGLFFHVCKQRKLDPMLKQIYAIPRKNKDGDRHELTIQVSIDGLRMIAERTGRYAPGRPTEFTFDEKGNVISATAYVKKQTVDGTWHEVSAVAFFNEYVQKTKDYKTGEWCVAQFWKQMPCGQIEKCAEAKAIRKAFPGETSGLYAKEEMEQAETIDAEIRPSDEDLKESPLLSLRKEALEIYACLAGSNKAKAELEMNNRKIQDDFSNASEEQLKFMVDGMKSLQGVKS